MTTAIVRRSRRRDRGWRDRSSPGVAGRQNDRDRKLLREGERRNVGAREGQEFQRFTVRRRHLAGEVSPLSDTLGMRIERLAEPAKRWAAEHEAGHLEEAKQAMADFSRQARFAGFGR